MVSLLGSYTVHTVEDVQNVVRSSVEKGHGLTPVGGGARLHIGQNSIKDCYGLSTTALNRIVEYNSDDLVVVSEAGVTVAALQERLRRAGQWLPIDIAAPDRQTLGGIVASRANSMIRAHYGSVRDLLIGVEVVNAASEVVVGGGKVVKNVAGYDLPKLYCGSWGTLGVLTKVNFKVSPLPEQDRSLLIVLSKDYNSEDLIDCLLARFNPTSALLFNHNAAVKILGPGAERAQYLLVRFMGLVEDVELSIDGVAAVASPFAASMIALPDQVSMPLLRLLTDFSIEDAPLSVEYHVLSSQVGAHARMIDWIASKYGISAEVVADVSTGIVSAHYFDIDEEYSDWTGFLPEFQDKSLRVGGSLIVERMPDFWRSAGFPVWSPILSDFKIMKLIKQKLDPVNVFNPGRFVGGI